MKKSWKRKKYKKYNSRHARKQYKHKKEYKNYLINKNKSTYKESNTPYRDDSREIKDKIVYAPEKFLFVENNEEVLSFIEVMNNHLKKKNSVFVKLERVTVIDNSAITVLLSIVMEFKKKNIGFNGNFPKERKAKELILKSEFVWHIRNSIDYTHRYNIGKDDQILTLGDYAVISEEGIPIMEATSKTIWGERKMLKGLQRILIELMQNTNNHASTIANHDERWWLSINHNKEEKKVIFIFVDFGIGIFKSLESEDRSNKFKDFYSKLKEIFMPNHEILRSILDGTMHKTVIGEDNRGRGIPSLKLCIDRNQISNLLIISNNVYADLENDVFRSNNNFCGTFFRWEINEESENKEWTI